MFAFELYKELKAAKYGYTSNVSPNNETPLAHNGVDGSFTDNESQIGQPQFNAFAGKGVSIG